MRRANNSKVPNYKLDEITEIKEIKPSIKIPINDALDGKVTEIKESKPQTKIEFNSNSVKESTALANKNLVISAIQRVSPTKTPNHPMLDHEITARIRERSTSIPFEDPRSTKESQVATVVKAGRKKRRELPESAIKHPRKYYRNRQMERDRKFRNERDNQQKNLRRKRILELKKQLYGSLSFQQLKPHIVLEFFEAIEAEQDREHKKMIAYKKVSKKYNISVRTVFKLVKEYESTEIFAKSRRGVHPKAVWALQNETAKELFIQKARELREKDRETAKWFLPTDKLLEWINSELLSSQVQERGSNFDIRSLQLWLHHCGFKHGETGKKGIYFDGHEREDVKKHRVEYIKNQRLKHCQYIRYDESQLDNPLYWKSDPQPFWNPRRGARGLEALPVLKVSHDESIYPLFSYVSRQWFEDGRPAILPKGDGRGYHVSDFITTFGPVKKVDGSPVRKTIGPIGQGCYWNSDQFLEQVEHAVRGLAKQYPHFRFDLKFDNAPLHKKKPEGAPVLEKMNRNPGGKQPKMRKTSWEINGVLREQSLTFRRLRRINGQLFEAGQPKGLQQIARERIEKGAKIRNLDSLKRDELIAELKKFKDFRNVKPMLFELIDELNQELFNGEQRITAEYLPKYHCELAEIEMWWRNSKYTFRKTNDRQWSTISKRVKQSLEQFPIKYYATLFRQVKAIELAYADGVKTNELLKLKETNFPALLEKLAKKRKHHRSPIKIQNNKNWDFIIVNEVTPRIHIPIKILYDITRQI